MEQIRDAQKYLNDVRHNLASLLASQLGDYEYLALENTVRLIGIVDEKLTEIKKLLAEQKESNK